MAKLTRRTLLAAGGITMLFGLFGQRAAQAAGDAHAFSFDAIDGGTISLADYAGKAVLVVNTASKCGFTSQYEGLEALWDRYKDRGLIVLGVPCNDFGGQEPGSAEEIVDFCTTTFDVTFPMTAKVHVKGDQSHPFYQWARKTLGSAAAPQWNFHKYLIAPDGRLVDWFSTVTDPQSDRVTKAVESVGR
jgi:glutathione peroxidase